VKDLAPPSGQMPPQQVRLRAGEAIELAPWATAAADHHLAEHPEELERYGVHARDWCVHDLQWVCLWAIMDADGQAIDFDAQLAWLARLLAARAYPLGSLADALDSLAEELPDTLPDAAVKLRAGAQRVRP
jgi:hypothetical protein